MSSGAMKKRLNVFERYLTLWVGLCMGIGLALGKAFPAAVDALRRLELGDGSQIKVTVARWLTPSGHSISEKGLDPDMPRNLAKSVTVK